MTKVCRLCLSRLQRGSKYFNVNAVESFTGFMPYRDQLTTCIPEMALDLIPNPVICNTCRTALKSSYEFKSRCLLVEKKIRQYVESQGCEDEVNYDLSKVSTNDLPPIYKLNFTKKELDLVESRVEQQREQLLDATPQITDQKSDGKLRQLPQQILSKNSELLLQLQREIVLPNNSEIEISKNIAIIPNKRLRRLTPSKVKVDIDDNDAVVCNRCDETFNSADQLAVHKKSHCQGSSLDEFECNFCKEGFKTLQQLRRHNNICSRVMNKAEVTNTILTKRPHLPTKAKNHLKRWLFKHTDHPYPTDHEKQMLMQETNLSLLQVENWFINARRRILQDLTKLKNRGVRVEDLHEHNVGLQASDTEVEEMKRIVSSMLDTTNILETRPLVYAPRRRGKYKRYSASFLSVSDNIEEQNGGDEDMDADEGEVTNDTQMLERDMRNQTPPTMHIKVEAELSQGPEEIVSLPTLKNEPVDDESTDEAEEEEEKMEQIKNGER